MSSSGTMPPPKTTMSPASRSSSSSISLRNSVMWAPERTERPISVGVLLDGGLDDLLGRLVQARVDDLVAGVAQRPGDDLGAAVVPVESRLGHHDADRSRHDTHTFVETARGAALLGRGTAPEGLRRSVGTLADAAHRRPGHWSRRVTSPTSGAPRWARQSGAAAAACDAVHTGICTEMGLSTLSTRVGGFVSPDVRTFCSWLTIVLTPAPSPGAVPSTPREHPRPRQLGSTAPTNPVVPTAVTAKPSFAAFLPRPPLVGVAALALAAVGALTASSPAAAPSELTAGMSALAARPRLGVSGTSDVASARARGPPRAGGQPRLPARGAPGRRRRRQLQAAAEKQAKERNAALAAARRQRREAGRR